MPASLGGSDLANSDVPYFQRGSEESCCTITAPRATMIGRDGHVVPDLSVSNRSRGTTTGLALSNLRINPEIEDHAFSLQALGSQRPLAVKES